MTIAGFAISAGFALAWCDIEVFVDAEPFGSVDKIDVSVAGFVMMGAGANEVVGPLHRWVKSCDSTVTVAASRARYILLDSARSCRVEGATPRSSTAALVGSEDGRLRGFILRSADEFFPRQAEHWGTPLWEGPPPRRASEVLETALAQMRELRRSIPRATGLALDVAKVTARGVERVRVPFGEHDFV